MRTLLLGLISFVTVAFGVSAEPLSLAGDWDGTLDAGVAQLRLVLHMKTNNDGSYTATLDSIDQGANGIPVEKVTFKDDTLKLDIPAVHGSYEGSVDAEAKTLTGKWAQATTLPLTFKKRSSTEKAVTPSAIDGAWQGLLVAGEQKLRIALQVRTGGDGVLGVLFVSLDQGPSSLSGNNVTFDGASLSFDVPAVHGRYEGRLAEDKNTMHGTWTQGAALPLDFIKH